MWRVALQMLVGDRMKYIALVAGVAFAALLVTQQASIFWGYSRATGAWIRDTGQGDLWVVDPQAKFADDIKPMQDTVLTRVRGVEGVEWAVPIYKGYLKLRLPDGTLAQSRVVGLDDATLMGAPPVMVEGKLDDLRKDRAVFINEKDLTGELAMPNKPGAKLKVGDRVSINDHEVEVAGIFRSTPEFFWEPVVYTTYTRALTIAPRERKLMNYVKVKVAAGRDVAQVQAAIREATGMAAMTESEFTTKTILYIIDKTGILVNFGITIALGFVIGVLVAGQTFYTFILDNVRHFGALKAMGAGNWRLLGMMLMQVLLVGLIGYGLGAGVASATGIMLTGIGLNFTMAWQIPVFGGLAVVGCCLVAGLLGMVKVVRLEPAVVFKG
jgi:putative ABC transport system permease protein